MEQVVNYVRENPDCKSKDIAKHFGCTTKDVNRNRGEYIGIYSNPAIISTDYKHRVKETVPAPEPEGNVCPICLEPPTNPVSGGCCPYPMCRECFIELRNSDSENSDKCPHCRETFPWAVPNNRARRMPDQDEIDRLRQELAIIRGELNSSRSVGAHLEQRLAETRSQLEIARGWTTLGELHERAQEEFLERAQGEIPLPDADQEIPMNAVVQQDPRVRIPVRFRARNDND